MGRSTHGLVHPWVGLRQKSHGLRNCKVLCWVDPIALVGWVGSELDLVVHGLNHDWVELAFKNGPMSMFGLDFLILVC